MFTVHKRKNNERRPIPAPVLVLGGLIIGIGVGVLMMLARAPEEPPPTAVQAIVDSVSMDELQFVPVAPEIVVVENQPPETVTVPLLVDAAACKVVLLRTGEHFCTIQSAIDAATDSQDVVLVGAGVYHENLLIENRSLTLRGEDSPVLDPISAATIRVHQGALALSDFTIRGHDTGIYISDLYQQSISIQHVTFQINPLQGYGFGILLEGGQEAALNVMDSTFQVGGTAIEISGGKMHSVNFADVVFQMPSIVLHVAEGKRHEVHFAPDVSFQTSGMVVSVERSRHITVNAQDTLLSEERVDIRGGNSNVVYR